MQEVTEMHHDLDKREPGDQPKYFARRPVGLGYNAEWDHRQDQGQYKAGQVGPTLSAEFGVSVAQAKPPK